VTVLRSATATAHYLYNIIITSRGFRQPATIAATSNRARVNIGAETLDKRILNIIILILNPSHYNHHSAIVIIRFYALGNVYASVSSNLLCALRFSLLYARSLPTYIIARVRKHRATIVYFLLIIHHRIIILREDGVHRVVS